MPSSSGPHSWMLSATWMLRHVQRGEFLQGVGATAGRRHVVVADQQQGGNARCGQAHHAPPPFALEGGLRVAIFVGVTGEDDEIDLLR